MEGLKYDIGPKKPKNQSHRYKCLSKCVLSTPHSSRKKDGGPKCRQENVQNPFASTHVYLMSFSPCALCVYRHIKHVTCILFCLTYYICRLKQVIFGCP